MKKLLLLKHWQLFIIITGLPIIFQILAINSIISSQNPTFIIVAMPIIMSVFIIIFFGWLYAIGTNLHKKLPSPIKMNINRFRILLFIPLIYITFIFVFMFSVFSKFPSGEQPNIAIFAVIFPLHLFSMFCIFYCLFFNAKALKTIEWQKEVTFSDFAGEFFLIWFFPLGIWIIQPRINKIFQSTEAPTSDLSSLV